MDGVLRLYDVETARQTILRRRPVGQVTPSPALQAGIEARFGEPLSPEEAVARILADVRERGDAALRDWTARLDGVRLERFAVPREAWRAAWEGLDPALQDALRLAADRIRAFHQQEPLHSWLSWNAEGSALGQRIVPLRRVGVYVPGGTAPLPSTLLMSVIPARVAGVEEIVVATPPGGDGEVAPVILAAAYLAGVTALYRLGGAQAVAALAYGTESVPAVDKVVGPGNLFVTLAKRQVFGQVGIDGLPGPTETMVIADETARPAWVAADLLAQAEHDVLATAILLTPHRPLAEAVQREVARRLEALSRAEIIARSLTGQGGIVLVRDLDEAVALANGYGAEHLCLAVADPWALAGRVHNAGGLFLGEHSFEVLGDYVAGPTHVMPTMGTARFASPLTVRDFVKVISLFALSPAEAARLSGPAARLAEAEGLTAHAAAARLRCEEETP